MIFPIPQAAEEVIVQFRSLNSDTLHPFYINWVQKFATAGAQVILGGIRGKYQTIPIPGADTTLDYSRLLTEAQAEKEKLIETLRLDLELTSKEKQLERETAEKDNKREGEANDPVFIYIG